MKEQKYFCPYINKCRQPTHRNCHQKYETCASYRYSRIKDHRKIKPKSGLERFKDRYPSYAEMFIGSIPLETLLRLKIKPKHLNTNIF